MTGATIDLPRREEAFERERPLEVLSSAELADCTCPEPCERDHDRD
jgi:hypothetical protein